MAVRSGRAAGGQRVDCGRRGIGAAGGLAGLYDDGESESPGPLNLGNPAELSIRALAEQIIALVGSKSKIVSEPLPEDDPQQRQPDISLAQSEIGWGPTTSLDEGLKATIDYFDRLLAED